MDDRDSDRNPRRGPGRIWAGLFLLLIGGVLLLDQLGFPLPDFLFKWEFILIALGIFVGLRHKFRGAGWLIMIVIGGVYLAQDYYHNFSIHRFIWPGILIFVGLMIILRPSRHRYGHGWREDWRADWERRSRWGEGRRWHESRGWGNSAYPDADPASSGTSSGSASGASTTFSASSHESYSSDDYIDTTSIFAGVHKKVVSKNFKGGDVTTVLGGSEIDLSQADFNGTVRLDVTQIMGGTKIIVPPHWEVRSEITAVFAGFEDKRQQPTAINPEKVLIIDGTSILGGIELKNY
jgi:Cell wall-active antibiotics response 4TMS YvqF